MRLANARGGWPRPVDDRDIKVVVRNDSLDVELLGFLALRRVGDFSQCYGACADAQPGSSLGISPEIPQPVGLRPQNSHRIERLAVPDSSNRPAAALARLATGHCQEREATRNR